MIFPYLDIQKTCKGQGGSLPQPSEAFPKRESGGARLLRAGAQCPLAKDTYFCVDLITTSLRPQWESLVKKGNHPHMALIKVSESI